MSLRGHLDVAVGDGQVDFAFTVENAGTGPVDLEFRSGKTADVAVYRDDAEVWRWSDGQLFTQAVGTETLASGESLTREMSWTDPSPGEYTAEASLAATSVSLARRARFEVR